MNCISVLDMGILIKLQSDKTFSLFAVCGVWLQQLALQKDTVVRGSFFFSFLKEKMTTYKKQSVLKAPKIIFVNVMQEK